MKGKDLESSIMRDSKQSEGSTEDRGGQLLPGIPDDITIDEIARRLPWTCWVNLDKVSRCWQRTIQSDQIHEARVRSGCTETLVVLCGDSNNCRNTISLYSSKDDFCYPLPPIPEFPSGFPRSFKCTSLGSNLYILGGRGDSKSDASQARSEIYVLNLAEMQWKPLASMKYPRTEFGCGVLNGKIYVLGGVSSSEEPVLESEVYDPKENAWSSIAPMVSGRSLCKVTILGEEIFVYNGRIDKELGQEGLSAEIYNLLKNEWSHMEGFTRNCEEFVVSKGGKLHKVTQSRMDVYDNRANSWKPWQSISLGEFEGSDSFRVCLTDVVPVDNELWSVMSWKNTNARDGQKRYGTWLMRSQGCGGEGKAVVWQRVQHSQGTLRSLSTIQI